MEGAEKRAVDAFERSLEVSALGKRLTSRQQVTLRKLRLEIFEVRQSGPSLVLHPMRW